MWCRRRLRVFRFTAGVLSLKPVRLQGFVGSYKDAKRILGVPYYNYSLMGPQTLF